MDRERFDALTRLFAARGSRRSALAALLGAAVFGLDRGETAAKSKGKDKKPRRGNDRGGQGGKAKNKNKKRNKKRQTSTEAVPATCFTGSPCVPAPSASLTKCDFSHSNTFANFNCTRCSLTKANLAEADASGANFSNASLVDACLVDADLSGADLTRAGLANAIFCRTRMPNGTINNSGCNRGTTCCPTCQEIGGACGGALGGSCCGGATCQGGVCTCPPSRPHDCNGVCRACCDDAQCGGDTPRCCTGTCRGCCTNSDCPSGLCRNGVCCTPDSRETTCGIGTQNPKCGRVTNNCGQPVDCPACADRVCQDATCSGPPASTCSYRTSPNGQPGTDCATICCQGRCCPTDDDVCVVLPSDDDVGIPECCTPQSDRLTCGVGTPTPKCGTVRNNCGLEVNCQCPPVRCRTVSCSSTTNGICQVTGNQDNLSPCTTDQDDPGVCCGGECLAGVCCANADCQPSGNTCANGGCRCGGGLVCAEPRETCCLAPPSGTCVDTTISPTNCGRCGVFCAAPICNTPRCSGGTCGITPITGSQTPGCEAPGNLCCGGSCKTILTDPANCGACGTVCAAPNPHCCGQGCRECCTDAQCTNANAPSCLNFQCVTEEERIFARVRTVVANILGIDEASITMESEFRDLGADSLDLVDLILALEDEFGISISDEEVESIDTVGDAVRYIIANGG